MWTHAPPNPLPSSSSRQRHIWVLILICRPMFQSLPPDSSPNHSLPAQTTVHPLTYPDPFWSTLTKHCNITPHLTQHLLPKWFSSTFFPFSFSGCFISLLKTNTNLFHEASITSVPSMNLTVTMHIPRSPWVRSSLLESLPPPFFHSLETHTVNFVPLFPPVVIQRR